MRNKELLEVWSDKELGKAIFREEREIIIPILLHAAKNAVKILEIGAGEGRIVKVLQKSVSADFYSLDITRKVKYAPGYRVVGDARALPFKDNVFDLVYSLGVVEHFAETGEAIKEHARVTRKGGYVFISVPHFSPLGFYKRVKFFIGKRLKNWKGDFVSFVGKHLTCSELRQHVLNAKLKILRLEPIPKFTPLSESIERPFLQRLIPARFGGFVYCLAQKV